MTSIDAQVRKEVEWTEEDLQSHVLEIAEPYGWIWHHDYDSRRSTAGRFSNGMMRNSSGW